MKRRLSSSYAFTLIELLVVILVIGILIAVAAPSFLGQTEKAHDSAAKQNLAVAYKAAKASTVKVINQGSYDATEVRDEINASEGGRLNATLGDCPTDATTDINDIIVDSSYTGGTNLLLCNDPDRKIWYLQVTSGVLQPIAYVGEGDEVPGDTAGPSLYDLHVVSFTDGVSQTRYYTDDVAFEDYPNVCAGPPCLVASPAQWVYLVELVDGNGPNQYCNAENNQYTAGEDLGGWIAPVDFRDCDIQGVTNGGELAWDANGLITSGPFAP